MNSTGLGHNAKDHLGIAHVALTPNAGAHRAPHLLPGGGQDHITSTAHVVPEPARKRVQPECRMLINLLTYDSYLHLHTLRFEFGLSFSFKLGSGCASRLGRGFASAVAGTGRVGARSASASGRRPVRLDSSGFR